MRENLEIYRQIPLLPLVYPEQNNASFPEIEERGAVFTRSEVVEFILDLTGYIPSRPLHNMRLLEPSIGQGDFLLPVINRLLAAWSSNPHETRNITELKDAIRGVELHPSTFFQTRQRVMDHLIGYGFSLSESIMLAHAWLVQADFLLTEFDTAFHFVIGNPPYVRQELIPDFLMAQYRARYRTIFDRADLYIPFIERSLTLLEKGGHLGYICADRWMKNRYGGPLRQMIAEQFHLKIYVDMVDTPAFQSDVIAYPAITIIAREKGKVTQIAHRPEITSDALSELASVLALSSHNNGSQVRTLEGVAVGSEPWILESPDQLALVRRLEREFPTLEETGCKVGIGVATGADKAFVAPYDALDIEPDRKLRLVTTRDILTGEVNWRGLGVVNPFEENGSLVNLSNYPRLKQYLEERKTEIARRHIAQKVPSQWYRTIDRIDPLLASTPKLLIPDIKGEAQIVFEPGELYPHHNLYFIRSDSWNLKALQAVLRSGIARLFVSIYSTRMRGGYMRFQAQYLRRIRLPYWQQVPEFLKQELISASERGDIETCNQVVCKLYKLSDVECEALGGSKE